MFAPDSVITHIRTAAQCAAIDVDQDINTGEFDENGNDMWQLCVSKAAKKCQDAEERRGALLAQLLVRAQ